MRIRNAYDTALGMMRQEQWDEALTILNGMLNVRWDDSMLFFLIATCQRSKGNEALAYALFLTALEYKQDFFIPIYKCLIASSCSPRKYNVSAYSKCDSHTQN